MKLSEKTVLSLLSFETHAIRWGEFGRGCNIGPFSFEWAPQQVRQKSTSTDMVYENFVFKGKPTSNKQKKFHENKDTYA